MSKALLVLNGEFPKKFHPRENYVLIASTDGGYLHLKQLNVGTDLVIGDFDSSLRLESEEEEMWIHTPDQNYTDFEKALAVLYEIGIDDIDVYAASGRSQDHFLGNLFAAYVWRKYLNITFYDDFGYYFFAKKKTIIETKKGAIISLFPYTKVERVRTYGLKYPLEGENLSPKRRMGIRNEAILEKVKIYFKKGGLLVFVNEA